MSKSDAPPKKSPYKRTDFRYEIWLKDRKALRAKAKKESFKVEANLNASLPKKALNAVCVDTTKARSTLDVIRICLRDLGWREVCKSQFWSMRFGCHRNALHSQDAGVTRKRGNLERNSW